MWIKFLLCRWNEDTVNQHFLIELREQKRISFYVVVEVVYKIMFVGKVVLPKRLQITDETQYWDQTWSSSNFSFHFTVLFKNLHSWSLLACSFCIETCQAFGFQVALIRSTEYNNSLVHICSDSYHVMIANLFNGVPPPSTLPCRMWHWPHHFYRYPYGTKLMKMKRIVVW